MTKDGLISVRNPCISDDLLLSGFLLDKKPDPVKTYLRYGKLKDIDMDVLNSDLQKLNFPTESLDFMVQRYNFNLSETLQNNAPLIEKYVRIRPNTAWFNNHIWHAKVMKRRLERKYRKSGLEADLEKYKEQCKTVKHFLTEYKTEFYSCKINQSRNDIKCCMICLNHY